MRQAAVPASASAATTASSGTPSAERDGGRLRRVRAPGARRAPRAGPPALPHGDSSRSAARSSASSAHVAGADVGVVGPAADAQHPRAAVRATSVVGRVAVGVQHREPVGRERLEQLALHPRDAVAATEVLGVGEPDVGDDADVGPGDRRRARRCCPRSVRPSRATTTSVPSGASSSVTGSPISLLNDAALACTASAGASAAAVRSLVDGLPGRPGDRRRPSRAARRVRAQRPERRRARASTSSHDDHGAVDARRRTRSTSAATAPRGERVGDEVVAVALAAERDEARRRARAPGSRTRTPSRRGRPGRPCSAPPVIAAISRGSGPRERLQLLAGDDAVVERDRRRSAVVWPVSWPLPGDDARRRPARASANASRIAGAAVELDHVARRARRARPPRHHRPRSPPDPRSAGCRTSGRPRRRRAGHRGPSRRASPRSRSPPHPNTTTTRPVAREAPRLGRAAARARPGVWA